MPDQGTRSMFTTCLSMGVWLGILATLGLGSALCPVQLPAYPLRLAFSINTFRSGWHPNAVLSRW